MIDTTKTKPLEPHQYRLIVEFNELDAKLRKLDDFILSPAFNSIDEAKQSHLKMQKQAMQNYISILSLRISEFIPRKLDDAGSDVKAPPMIDFNNSLPTIRVGNSWVDLSRVQTIDDPVNGRYQMAMVSGVIVWADDAQTPHEQVLAAWRGIRRQQVLR